MTETPSPEVHYSDPAATHQHVAFHILNPDDIDPETGVCKICAGLSDAVQPAVEVTPELTAALTGVPLEAVQQLQGATAETVEPMDFATYGPPEYLEAELPQAPPEPTSSPASAEPPAEVPSQVAPPAAAASPEVPTPAAVVDSVPSPALDQPAPAALGQALHVAPPVEPVSAQSDAPVEARPVTARDRLRGLMRELVEVLESLTKEGA